METTPSNKLCFFSTRSRDVLHRLIACLGLCFLSACTQLQGLSRVGARQSLRIDASQTYSVSFLCTGKDADACDDGEIQRLFASGLRARGIRLATPQTATRTLTMACSKVVQRPRNEPPLAPGSRLWYQRRFLGPSRLRTTGALFSQSALRLDITIRPTQPPDDTFPPTELKATTVITNKSSEGLKAAIDLLIGALQAPTPLE